MGKEIRARGAAQGADMPTVLKETHLSKAVKDGSFIKDGDPVGIEGVKYDFRIGARFLKASFGQPISWEGLTESEKAALQVDPGEVVFVITKERVCLPGNMMAMLSPKRALAHQGILVMGGLAVDPNYSGTLWVGLYNFASTPFKLRPGLKLIAGMFYDLSPEEAVPDDVAREVTDFPEELIMLIRNYKPIELKGLKDELDDTRKELEGLREDFRSDKGWRDDFKAGLEQHNKQLDKLIDGLKDESDIRKRDDAEIKSRLDGMSNLFFSGKLVFWVIVSLVSIAATAVITVLITNAMSPHQAPPAPTASVAPQPAPQPAPQTDGTP